jgi:AcrR family transcriptional regulator
MARILGATRDLLDDEPFEQLTVQQIADRAGCSVGAIYGRFSNKDAILPLLLELHYSELEEELRTRFAAEAWHGADLASRVTGLVGHLVETARRQRGLIRTLVLRNYQRPDSIPAAIRAAASRILTFLADFLLERRHEMRRDDEQTAVDIGLLMVGAAIRERIVLVGAPQASALSLSDEDFSRQLAAALHACLTASTPPVATRDRDLTSTGA